MDATGGTTYAPVGTTQLLSVPYALAADTLVTSAGEGITLVSPNGTPYQLTVDNSGNLSLPTSGSTGTIPGQLYLYGTFNSFNAATSLLFGNTGYNFYCYKYLTSGGQLKFLADNNSGASVYGLNAAQELVLGGSPYTIPSNGFYLLSITHNNNPMQLEYTQQFAPIVYNTYNGATTNPTYATATNTFSFTVNGITTANNHFVFDMPSGENNLQNYGDYLADGTLDAGGTEIAFSRR